MIYTLDTNVVIDALRRPVDMSRLQEFLTWALPQTALSSVVASELLAGARTESARRVVEREFLGAFERRGRIVAPSVAAWTQTGLALSRAPGSEAWQNDLLLAHTAREYGWTVITRDTDFARLRPLIKGLRVASPFPPRVTGARRTG
jgi:predicted nucleic acid-binding protein